MSNYDILIKYTVGDKMALSIFEKRLVQSIIKDLNVNQYKRSKYLLLSFDGVKALIEEESFVPYRINYLNNDTVYRLLEDINNNPSFYYKINLTSIYENAFINRNNNFISTLLKNFPDLTTKCLFHNRDFRNKDKFINSASPDEILIILNSYRQNRNDYSLIFGVMDDDQKITLLISRLNDQDKAQFVDLIPYYDTSLEQILSSVKDHEVLKDILYNYICNREYSISETEQFTNFISHEELFEISLKYASEHKDNIPKYFNSFTISERLQLLDSMKNIGGVYQYEFIKKIISDSLDTEKNLLIYDQIKDIFARHNINNFSNLYGFDIKINDIVSTMSTDELLNLIKEIKHSSLREIIIKNDNVWTKKEIFSYLLETDIAFIYDKIMKNIDFSQYSDDVKDLFCSKEATIALAKYGNVGLLNLKLMNNSNAPIDEHYAKILSHFADDDFCYELLKQNPQTLALCLNLNPKPELMLYAKDQGYYPEYSTYYFLNNHPEFKEEWFNILKSFDPHNPNFNTVFSSLIMNTDEEVKDILFHKAAQSINITYNDFVSKFNALKKVNCEILSTFDYRLFGEKFNFLTMDKIEFIGAHRNISQTLCDLSDSKIETIKRIISYSSNINWIDLLDRALTNIDDYQALIDNLKGQTLSVDDIGLLTKALVQKNTLNIQSYQDLQNYNQLINNRIALFSKSDNINELKEAISLSVLGLDYTEFVRISEVYCSDLDNLNKYSKNEDLIKALTFIKKVSTCQDINVLREILANTPRMNLSNEFIVNFDSEIRREFAGLYNATLYHVNEKDKTNTLYFKEVKTDGDKTVVIEVPKGEGEAVSFYSPIGLDPNNQSEFSIMMTSLGAYSDHQEPDDYYSNWNVDMISSHGFCCSYLTNDNLGTARICHAVLGFTDFSLDSLLLSAPYDIGSNNANRSFNTSRATNTCYCTPRGMVDNTRHTHNEVVWERRNLGAGGSFKKEPSYVIFFCEDMASLSPEEKNIYQSTIKAAVQLGRGKPLPVVVIERAKIAKYQQQEIISDLRSLKDPYESGLLKKIITRSISNVVGNTYAPNINNLYFNETFQDFVTNQIQNYIISLMKSGNSQSAIQAINELNETMQHEMNNTVSHDVSSISIKLNNLSMNLQMILKLFENNKALNSPTVSNLISLIMNINDDNYTKRWNDYLSNHHNNDCYDYSSIRSNIIQAIQNNTLIDKIVELEQDNIYKDNTPYNNRHFANMFLYASLFYNTSSSYIYNIKLEEILDAIKFSQCSYMEGNDKKNTASALAKAETIMDSKGYNDEQKEKIKILILLQNEKNLTPERVDEIFKEHRIAKNPFYNTQDLEHAVNIMHDAMCLEHTRFITDGEIESRYFYDQSFYKFTKLAYQLQEGYAMIDLNEYIKDHPEIRTDILQAEKNQNPQTIIRNLRKKRFVAPEYSNNTFEDAFLSLDVPEKTDPLNLISVKMKAYGDLPPQISLLDFYKLVNKMPLYSYLKEQIAASQNLYLTTSAIHGATHANNVTLFATFIASSIGLTDHDIKTIIESSIYHDIGRIDDNNNKSHGRLGAIKYGTLVESPSDINKEEVQFLIEAHAARTFADVKEMLVAYHFPESDYERLLKMAAVIRDADALDRTRFRLNQKDNNLKTDYLCYDISKKMIEACQRLNYIIYEDFIKTKTESDNITLS